MANMSIDITDSVKIDNGDVQSALSGLLQARFIAERHGVKRIAAMLDVGLSRAKQILYGEAAPTAAQIFQLMKDMDPAFAPSLVNIMTGGELVQVADKAKALHWAETLQKAADMIRAEARNEEINHAIRNRRM